MGELVEQELDGVSGDLEKVANNTVVLAEKQYEYLIKGTSDNTRRAYRAAIRQFELHGGMLPATEQDVADYIVKRAGVLNPRTLSLHLTALSNWHAYQKFSDPTKPVRIQKMMSGIYREHGKPKRKARALHPEHIKKLIQECRRNKNLKGLRDSALIQTAYFGAFRRSELVNIQVEHIQFDSKGLLILIPKSKTDQSGEGKVKALPYADSNSDNIICPVKAMRKWLEESGIETGFIFRAINRWDELQEKPLHPDSINTILKTCAKKCGLDFVDEISSHSTRRGFASSASNVGAEFLDIKRQGGWQSDNTVREYIEEGQLFENNAAGWLLKVGFSDEQLF